MRLKSGDGSTYNTLAARKQNAAQRVKKYTAFQGNGADGGFGVNTAAFSDRGADEVLQMPVRAAYRR